MRTNWLLAATLCAVSSVAYAKSYETVVTSGQGETLDQAIDVGLRRAVEQVSGVSIDSGRISTTTYSSDNEKSDVKSALVEGTEMTTKGNVKYRILSEKCLNDFCNVRLEVQVEVDPRDKVKDLNANRRTIAMGDFTGPHSKTMTNKVKDLLVQDRKFKVLNDKSDPALQYLVTGKVVEAATHKRVVDNSRTVELTGEYIKDVKTYYSSKVLIEFKIIDVMHNQIKWSATIPTTSSRNNLSLLIDLAADKVFNQLKDNIYPLVVLVGENGSIVLNSGGDTVNQGEYFDVFTLGEKFIDPITKESLGRDETYVATVKVAKVLPKLAYLEVVKGNKASIKTNSIARKSEYRPAVKPSTVSKPKPKPAPEKEKSVGIIL
ncbi:hypothetical protein [Vibrio taketomensis]|uniref:hypothetical protein n=1 Tax=Vibrio taketomensis TaxID=2572923 RepID=UPI001389D5A4|nr:hypothetical protein [Vibrio taketomensis]